MRTFARLGFIFLAVLGAAKNTPGHTAATWNPENLSLQCLGGTTSSVPVILTVSDTLRDVDVLFAFPLRRFLSVTPSHFDVVAANTQVTIEVACNIAENERLRHRSGLL